MIKHEIKKVLYHYKGWLLVVLMLIFTSVGLMITPKMPEQFVNEATTYYYQQLHGKLTDDKLQFIKNEMDNISQIQLKSELLLKQYQQAEITDEQYLNEMEILSSYRNKSVVIEYIKAYVDYLNMDWNRVYVDEMAMNQFLTIEIPYVVIVVIALLTIISFKNEEPMYSIIKTTVNGKKRLMPTKYFSMLIVNSTIFSIYFLLMITIKYPFDNGNILAVSLDSTRLFADNFLQTKVITYLFIIYLLQLLAVGVLTIICMRLALKPDVSGLNCVVIILGSYFIVFMLFSNQKWLYYLPMFGFFNPIRYFQTTSSSNTFSPFSYQEFILVLIIFVVILMVLIIQYKKVFKIIPLFLLLVGLSGCSKEHLEIKNIPFINNGTMHCNSNVCIDSSNQKLYDFKKKQIFAVNRNPLMDTESINGYMFHQYFYFIETSDEKWTLQRLNTETFKQEELYKDSLFQYDMLGNVVSTPSYTRPFQLYVDNDDIYLVFENRLVLFKNQQMKVLLEEKVSLLKVENYNIYFKNDRNQLFVFNIETGEKKRLIESLMGNALIHQREIYFTALRNDSLYKVNLDNDESLLLVNEPVNFLQVYNQQVYYTKVGEKGILIKDEQQVKKILESYMVYSFLIFDEKLLFLSYDDQSHQVVWFCYQNGDITKMFDSN